MKGNKVAIAATPAHPTVQLIKKPRFDEVFSPSGKVEGMDDRLQSVEGTQKNQVWALIVLLAGAIATAGFRTFFMGNP